MEPVNMLIHEYNPAVEDEENEAVENARGE
jgi:hypothetical protein